MLHSDLGADRGQCREGGREKCPELPARENRVHWKCPEKEVPKSHTGPELLGKQVEVPASPEEAELDRVENPHQDVRYLARFTAPEFTSLCPVTGQPDFAHLVIDYVPGKWLVESKSLKLYLFSFRNHGAFHEDCTVRIGKDLAALLEPVWLRIGGYWYPRGGIPIDVFWQTGAPPEGVWMPDQGVLPYRGRG
jgi:7-cyano-7-deazaguanine reductase